MANILAKICKDKQTHIEKQKLLKDEKRLRDEIILAPPTRGFEVKLGDVVRAKRNALIAELKKASPSEGLIRDDFDPTELAKAYENGGATCLSILTDEKYFQGNDEFINLAKSVCSLPILRKDFIIDTYQVLESRALGADCILLIMAVLDDDKAHELEELAISIGLDVLVEVHNEEELSRALTLNSKMIGINNRDLKTMKIDLSTTERLSKLIPDDYIIVCESGIKKYADLERMNKSEVYSFLVGTILMKFKGVEKATKKLLGDV